MPEIEALPGTGAEAEMERENGAGMPTVGEEKDYFALEEELRPCVLQIYCGDYRGSGVVWEITEKEVTVISSGHLLKNGDACEVLCHAGVYYEAKVDRILENCDVGFAVFSADALKEDGVELKAVVPSGRGKEELVPGEELLVYGSMDFVAGDFVRGYLIEAETSMQLEGNEEEQLLMLGRIVRGEEEESEPGDMAPDGEEGNAGGENLTDAAAGQGDDLPESAAAGQADNLRGDAAADQTDDLRKRGAVDAGMSGSGVFDKSGRLLGILAGGDGESGFAAVPVWQIAAGEDL